MAREPAGPLRCQEKSLYPNVRMAPGQNARPVPTLIHPQPPAWTCGSGGPGRARRTERPGARLGLLPLPRCRASISALFCRRTPRSLHRKVFKPAAFRAARERASILRRAAPLSPLSSGGPRHVHTGTLKASERPPPRPHLLGPPRAQHAPPPRGRRLVPAGSPPPAHLRFPGPAQLPRAPAEPAPGAPARASRAPGRGPPAGHTPALASDRLPSSGQLGLSRDVS